MIAHLLVTVLEHFKGSQEERVLVPVRASVVWLLVFLAVGNGRGAPAVQTLFCHAIHCRDADLDGFEAFLPKKRQQHITPRCYITALNAALQLRLTSRKGSRAASPRRQG